MGDQSDIDISPYKHAVLDMFCWMIEEAFDGDEQSLMANLKNIREEDWTALPPGGGRSIADILEHIGWCKWMYQDYAFGTASLRGYQPPLIPADGARTRPNNELIQWLREGHNKWLASVRVLKADGELERIRLTNWGEHLPTQTIIRIMIAHDYYHAGEINHLRSLLQRTDHWEYESSPGNGSMDSDAS
ncbi:MAG: hypothetical protein A2029_00845 [Chloroflexi bacterium RBG_19FT_COMBO_47_9]|nr:MAG: hypothetical protein A2029_00845 [Chloroflexi bacterium RBG_19FT_COMBO_47_9]